LEGKRRMKMTFGEEGLEEWREAAVDDESREARLRRSSSGVRWRKEHTTCF
jgi:hypothetical protein